MLFKVMAESDDRFFISWVNSVGDLVFRSGGSFFFKIFVVSCSQFCRILVRWKHFAHLFFQKK